MPRSDVEGAMDAANTLNIGLTQLRAAMETRLLACQDATSKVKNAASKYSDMVQDSDFGLDQNSADNKKKIGAA